MTSSPLTLEPLFSLGPVPISSPVVVTWGIMAILVALAAFMSRRLTLVPGRTQIVLETLVGALDAQIGDIVQRDPAPFRALIGTIFVYVLIANWSSLVPGVEPPTAHLETDAALALIVFCATIACAASPAI